MNFLYGLILIISRFHYIFMVSILITHFYIFQNPKQPRKLGREIPEFAQNARRSYVYTYEMIKFVFFLMVL